MTHREQFEAMARAAGILRSTGVSDEGGRTFVTVAAYGKQFPATAMFWFDAEGHMEGTFEATDRLGGF